MFVVPWDGIAAAAGRTTYAMLASPPADVDQTDISSNADDYGRDLSVDMTGFLNHGTPTGGAKYPTGACGAVGLGRDSLAHVRGRVGRIR